ncbi:hypothetical protein [Brevundimonas bullata]|uniref:hypothetical protein n=1 Tax=Brevundimonas bullata TaxID=13160 RepID=UPI003D9A783B
MANDNEEYPDVQGTIGSIPNEAPSNGLPSHDEIRMAANEQVQWNLKRKALNDQISAFRKGLKANGHILGKLDDEVRKLEWTPEEYKADRAASDHYAEAMAQPVGTQLELYGTDATPDPVRIQLKWRQLGVKHGIAGIGWANEPPEDCPFDCAQSYGEGHEEGQATVRRSFELRLARNAAEAANAAPADDEDDDGQIDIEDVANDDSDDTEHQQDAA